MASITIDGRPFKGSRIEITSGGRVLIDGVTQEDTLQGRVEIHAIEGVIENLEVEGDVHCGIVSGDVDATTASTLDRQIAVESRSGIASLTIDLSGVTQLGSAGVSVLAAARERARRQGSDCVLVAPPGSPAHHVLSLVQIPVVSGNVENVFAED